MTDTAIALFLCGWVSLLGGIAITAIRIVDRWVQRHQWVNVDE